MATKRTVASHVRRANGTGREKMAAIMVPKTIVDEFNCWKQAYTEIFGIPMTNESVMRWWLDHIGQTDRVNGKPVVNWDSSVAKTAKRKFKEFIAARNENPNQAGGPESEAVPVDPKADSNDV